MPLNFSTHLRLSVLTCERRETGFLSSLVRAEHCGAAQAGWLWGPEHQEMGGGDRESKMGSRQMGFGEVVNSSETLGRFLFWLKPAPFQRLISILNKGPLRYTLTTSSFQQLCWKQSLQHEHTSGLPINNKVTFPINFLIIKQNTAEEYKAKNNIKRKKKKKTATNKPCRFSEQQLSSS